ncbi:hypothetical protein GGX14DRAFT_580309 [Mycena pura]|uniref:DUF6532 domain-containing protein n=1 Tax=Mycena pura TaxID=153505 RepID=A0AAD6ULP9_9AGAR|nr:hypothetical protein GGX14DRAFT_580309 [Mycena pura]
MADDPLSDTSEEDAVTPQERRRRTRAQHLAEEEAENARRDKETGMICLYFNSSVWDEKQAQAEPESAKAGRKRASSTGDTGKTSKKAKAKAPANSDDDEVSVSTKRAPAKNVSKMLSKSVPKPKTKGAQSGAGRKYLARDVDSDDELVPQVPAAKPTKSITKKTNAAAGKAVAATRPKPRPRKASSDAEDDVLPSQSEDDPEEQSDPRSQSDAGEEDTLSDHLLERPQVIAARQSAPPELDDLLSFDTTDGLDRRRTSSSSAGSVPPETDYDYDMDQQDDMGKPAAEDGDMSDAPPRAAEYDWDDASPVKIKTRKLSSQQLKYIQEQPEFRSSKVIHARKAEPEVTSESDWHSSARLVYPAKGGPLKLLDQNDTLKAIIKSAIVMHLHETAFKVGYEAVVSRASLSRRLLRICAKKDPNGKHIERRAKQDTQFCSVLATIIYTRSGNLKTALRNGATSKVATHYEFNKPGTTPSQIRSIVKQLLHEQRYILPYAAAPARSANAPDNTDAAAVNDDNTAVVTDKIIKNFIPDMPFHAPAIVDLIHETWWNNMKALGFKHVSELVSHRTDRPRDVVLPDAMIGLVGANVWAAIVSYQTGRFVPAKEFSQARLENTYNSLVAVLENQRAGKSAKYFNTTMHKLYLKVFQSPDIAMEASGSANNVICLPVDSD